MLVEKIISYIVRERSSKYLQLYSDSINGPPPKQSGQPPLMLYVHVPFCEELCTYCSFHRVKYQEKLAIDYFSALRQEIKLYMQAGYDFNAVYIGGGTPTVLMDELITTINFIRSCFSIEEISVETNPNHLDEKTMQQLKLAGVQRLSVGVQSFDDEILKAMDRYHKYGSGAQIVNRIKAAQGYFKTLNIDMMFGFPKQTQEKLDRDLEIINELKIDQVTFYPLMLSTMTQREVQEKMGSMREGNCKSLYEKIRQTLGREYRPRTAWCFSRSDASIDEYVVNYDEYAGVGSGAFGYLQGTVYANTFDLAEYIRRANQGEFPVSGKRNCSPCSLIFYDFLMQFFDLSIDLNQLKKKHGTYLTLLLLPTIFFFLLVGGISSQGGRGLFVTTNPYFGVIMMREFFTSVNNFRDYCRLQSNRELSTEYYLERPVPV